MASVEDSLLTLGSIDRVHYETGVLLNDEDFIAEQNYHRGRLARALQYVVGTGTLAGLRVTHQAAVEGDAETVASEEKIKIEPGVALDGYGRLIELPGHYCMRLQRWYEQQSADALAQAWHAADDAWTGAAAGVVVDVHVEFVSCPRGKTPSFAVGPFDSIDAVTTARIRDSASLSLRVRSEDNPSVPLNPWPDVSGAADSAEAANLMREAIMNAWQGSAAQTKSVFLARMLIVADEPDGNERPLRAVSREVQINNGLRQFVLTTAALMRMLDININEGATDAA